MTNGQPNPLLKHIRKIVAAQTFRDLSDRELLVCFVDQHDEAAFAALVERHGSMIFGVCRRVLRSVHDAEDACQATFLVLARKAGSIRKKDSLGSWLHGVAFRVASDLKKRLARRQRGSAAADDVSGKDTVTEVTLREAQAALDEELQRLSENYRAPLILCYMEGKARDEAAQELGWKPGLLKSRLERGRELLRSRLISRGIAPSVALLSAVFAESASATMSPTLALATVKAAPLVALGKAMSGTVIPTNVVSLMEGVLKTMFLTKLKTMTAVLVAVAVLLPGARLVRLPALAAEPQPPAKAEKPAAREGDKPQAAPKPIVVKEDAYLKRVAWSQDGEVVATIGTTNEVVENGDEKSLVPSDTVKLWDPRTGKLKGSVPVEKHTSISALAFSPDKETVVIASGRPDERENPEVRLLDAKTLKLNHMVSDVSFGRVFRWSAVAFSPDGKRLALAGRDEGGYCVKLWDVKNKKLIGATKGGERLLADPTVVPPERKTDVTCLAFSPDGKLIAGGERDGKIRLFDGQTVETKAVLGDQHSGSVEGIAFSPDGKTLLSASQDKTVKLWDLPKGKLLRTLEEHKGAIMSAALSPDGKLLATGGNVDPEKEGDKRQVEVILWDTKTGERKQTISDLTSPVLSLAFSPDSKTLAVGGGMSYGLKEGGKMTGAMTLIPLK
jgi:RNA polymerase sigma factor (sigma-70 family)